jgi:hypothetical protein
VWVQFEKSNNKPVVVGYSIAALAAFFTAEWLIHLPGLDILLGFPVQLVGVLVLPYLAVKYLVNGDDILTDTGKAVVCPHWLYFHEQGVAAALRRLLVLSLSSPLAFDT